VLPPVPYELAQFWDRGLREHHNRRVHNRSQKKAHPSEDPEEVGHVPRDLRATAKRTPAVKSWLRVLEEPVREFVVERGLAVVDTAPAPADKEEAGGESSDETDPDDEEIVFVGRNGRMRDGKPWKKAQRQVVGGENPGATVERGMVLEMEEGGGGAFQCVFFLPFSLLSLVTSFLFPFLFNSSSSSSLSLLSFPPFLSFFFFALFFLFSFSLFYLSSVNAGYSQSLTGAGSPTPSRTTTASTPSRSWLATPRGASSMSAPSKSSRLPVTSRPVALYCRRLCGRRFEGCVRRGVGTKRTETKSSALHV
jgi:hypothetical protein